MKNINIQDKGGISITGFSFFFRWPKGLGQGTITDPAETSYSGTFINDVFQKLVLMTPSHISNFSSTPQHLSVALFRQKTHFP